MVKKIIFQNVGIQLVCQRNFVPQAMKICRPNDKKLQEDPTKFLTEPGSKKLRLRYSAGRTHHNFRPFCKHD